MTNVTNQKKGGEINIAVGNQRVAVIRHEIDIAEAVASGFTSGDLINVVTAPTDSFIEVLQVENATALSLGATPEVELGDGVDDDLFIAASTEVAVGGNHAIAVGNKLYTSEDTVSLKISGGTVTSGTIRLVLRMTDTSRREVGVAPKL